MSPVEITWLGHACFRLRGRDVTIVTDPLDGPALGYPPLNVTADVVTVSNDHTNHANVAGVGGTPRVFSGPGEYEIGGAMMWGIRTFRTETSAHGLPAKNCAFVIQLEDLRICHLGDLGHPLTAEQLTEIKDADVLLVPIGGHCTIAAAQAAEIVAQVEPKIVIPMHYGTAETAGHVALDPLDRFCREMGTPAFAPQARLNVTPSSLPQEATLVVLERRS